MRERPFLARATATAMAVALASFATACVGPRGPDPAELAPIRNERAARMPLPDALELEVGQLAALALAGRPDAAAEQLESVRALDAASRAAGAARSGLVDNARELVYAMGGPRAYAEGARRMLEEDGLDPALHRRLEVFLDAQPLTVADRKLREDQIVRVGSVANRLIAPLSRTALFGHVDPIEVGQAGLAALLLVHSTPTASVRERQALRAYRDFLERQSETRETRADDREVERVRAEVAVYAEKWRNLLHGESLEVAERALGAGRPDAARFHLERAERIQPGDPATAELLARVVEAARRQLSDLERSLRASDAPAPPDDAAERTRRSRALLSTAGGRLARAAADVSALATLAYEYRDEAEFVSAAAALDRGDDTLFIERMHEVAAGDVDTANMARHAQYLLGDPAQNPYEAYRSARWDDLGRRAAWIALGRFAAGPTERELPRPVEWLLDLPGLAVAIATFPLRVLRYPSTSPRFGGGVLHSGEQYLARFPYGVHAADIHEKLEDLYAAREQWSHALEHHVALPEPEPAVSARYRNAIAERTLRAADHARRRDVRASIYRSVISDYADTPYAETARRELQALVTEATPQRIRLSREFLRENRELCEPGALGLREELLDDDEDNGELAEEGVTLLGRNVVRIPLEGREPRDVAIEPERFARFVSLLEAVAYRQLETDEREEPVADPQRDLFLERARLGLVDVADVRPTASSEAVFLGTVEKHGALRRTESILPVELVVRGGLEDFGLAAFPRVVLPEESDDAFLYR